VKLSVVVPALDEATAIAETLASLAPLRDGGHEAIVVDGGSGDETVRIAERGADVVLAARRGRAVQMNVGASVATGSTLMFLHADCVLPPGAAIAIEGAHAAGYRWGRFDVHLRGRSPLLPLVAATMNARSALTGICTGDQALFVERGTFEAAGGFPPIPLMEDIALSVRLKRMAGRPKRVKLHVIASGRRWDRDGALATIARMASLRLAYWRGAEPASLAQRYYAHAPAPPVALKVFAKAPVPGRVKTRLAATIGARAAADVYRDLALHTLGVAAAARRAGVVDDVELWVAPESGAGSLQQWADQHGFVVKLQVGDDLGERMHGALRESLDRGVRALVVGSDVPGLDVAYLAQAVAALQRDDVVIGPADDGGYVLVGLARDVDVFSAMRWSTPDVLEHTRARLEAAQVSWRELPALWDVDTHDDLVRWQRQGAARGAAP
jgi:rSAM/selenodomain-associated transferase 2/rSAM/selenodomain-associated transferase 1